MNLLNLNDYAPKNFKSYTYMFFVIDNLSKFNWKDPLESKNEQSLKYSFEKIQKPSKLKPKLFETDDGGELVNESFTDFWNKNYYLKI